MDNFINSRYGKLVVIAITDKTDKYNRKIYKIHCDCGNDIYKTKNEVTNKRGPRSCGCILRQRKPKDITGKRFVKLVAVENTGIKCSNGDYNWRCICDCGNEVVTSIGRLNSGHTGSCGCLREEAIKYRDNYHGMSKTKEYKSWCKIKERCFNPNDFEYDNYGAKGISMCEEWKNNFIQFYKDMGKAPSKNHTIDRKDITKGYYKENCRWASSYVQSRNRGKHAEFTSEHKGVSFESSSEKWCAAFRIKYNEKIYGGRIYRYDTEQEAASAYNLVTKLVFNDADDTVYNLNNTTYPEELIDQNINFFKAHVPKLKEIAKLAYSESFVVDNSTEIS